MCFFHNYEPQKVSYEKYLHPRTELFIVHGKIPQHDWRKYTSTRTVVLYKCTHCEKFRTEELDGRWDLEDLLTIK